MASFWSAPDQLIASPTYQVNLLLWMAQSDNRARVPAVLAEAGYELLTVEERITLSPDLQQRLRAAGFKPSGFVAPDVILKAKKDYLVLECKRTMFGPDTPSQRQAISLLTLAPRQFENSRFMKAGAVQSVSLAYVSRCDDEHDELEGVTDARDRLAAAKIPVVEAGFVGLRSRNDAVVLESGTTGSLPAPLKAAITKNPVVHRTSPQEDVRFLYVIPWLPQTESEQDDYHKAVLAERVKVTAAELVDRARAGRDVYIRTTEIVGKLLEGLEKYWKNTAALTQLRQEIAAILRKQFTKLPSDAPAAIPQPDMAWAFSIRDQADKDTLVTALMSPGAYDFKDAPMQMTLDSAAASAPGTTTTTPEDPEGNATTSRSN